ncbi:unnamed protein product [Dovyalis caffra]|uniref:Uncharacterized protein n=1 Tax=Dovyalis caffra TaxID=77055 RepID=A0AAV1S4Z8_9ROSI|nr:unnamed protein product [Dovyalis caffra]
MSDPSASNSTFDQEVLKLPIFEGKYYSSWSKTMEENLRSDKVGLWDIVENGYERPKDATELATWPDDMKNKYRETDQKRDAEAFRFIQQAVSERIMTEVLTSEKAWDAFKKIRIQSSRQDKTVERYIEEVVSEPQMMELVATSQDAWEILKTLYPSPKDSDEDEVDGIRKMQKASIIVKCSREPKPLEENQMISSGRPKNFKTTSDGEGEMQMDIYQEREEEVTRSGLFRFAMKGDWNKVIEIYTRKAAAHITKITSSGDTALHIAVIDGREDTVQQLVNLMSLEEAKKALRVKNERGNTPLHLAAIVGNVRRLYYCIARKVYPRVEKKREVENNQNQSEKKEVDNDQNPSGKKEVEKEMKNYFPVGERNNDNETPLFLAALLGKKDAFLFLHCCLLDDQGSSYYRRKNGDTVLHVAIYGEYFDLAFQIIHLYPELVNSVNEVGLSPLHCLASTFVEKLEAENLEKYKDEGSNCFTDLPSQDGKNHGYDYPKNYETCTGRVKPRDHRLPTTCAKKESAPGNGLVPPNYGTAFELLKLVWKTILVIIGSGTTEVKRIKLKKEKHIWSVQVLDQILSKVLSYKYENNGKTPRRRLSSYAFDAENNQEITKEIQEATSKIPTKEKRETSILLAAKNGITEIVQKILDQFPVAIQDTNSEKKNVVLLAVENRQPQVYELLLNLAKQNKTKDRIFRQVDDKGNSARHLAAATVGEYKPWRIPGAALQMQWEIKWYKVCMMKKLTH